MIALPNTYTRLEYIESSGTQYIDTGFKPNQDTRVVMDFQMVSAYSAVTAMFGARDTNLATVPLMFNFWNSEAAQFRTDYFNSNEYFTVDTLLKRRTVDKNKNVTTLDGMTVTNAAATGQCSYNLYLFCCNGGGTARNFSSIKMYACKVYDNGTLIRDFMPCKNVAGTVGVWDTVNGIFYGNNGSGTFSGKELKGHKALIAGSAYNLKGGQTMVGGTAYKIKQGKTLVGGTAYKISFGKTMADFAEGDIVYLPENGVYQPFYVAKHNYESGLNGNGRTLLVRKNGYDKRYWGNTHYDSCPWETSLIHTWLNNDYKKLFPASVLDLIGTTTYYYKNAHESSIKTRADAFFLCSVMELGYGERGYTQYGGGREGSALPIASILWGSIQTDGLSSKESHWTRTSSKGERDGYVLIDAHCSTSNNRYDQPYYPEMTKCASRPTFTLPADATFDPNTNYLVV